MKYLTNIDLSQNQLQNAVIQPLATAPANPVLGQIYFDSTDKMLKQYNGTSWTTVGKIITYTIDKEDGTKSVTITLTPSEGTPSEVEIDLSDYTLSSELETILADYVTESALATALENYVEKETGKGLSTNDFTDALKDKLDGIEEGANKTIVDSALSDSSTNPVQNKVIKAAIDAKADPEDIPSVDDEISATSTNPVQNKVIKEALDGKVDTEAGKGLSTNDYTNTEKTKLAGIEEGANKTIVDSAMSDSSTNPVQNKVVKEYVDDAIEALPEPMIFKGSVGEGGTVTWTNLPAAADAEGWTYKVIEAHASSPAAKVGDTIISNGTEWIVIPSGDEPSGTVTSVGLTSDDDFFEVTGSPITSSGTIHIRSKLMMATGTIEAGETSVLIEEPGDMVCLLLKRLSISHLERRNM